MRIAIANRLVQIWAGVVRLISFGPTLLASSLLLLTTAPASAAPTVTGKALVAGIEDPGNVFVNLRAQGVIAGSGPLTVDLVSENVRVNGSISDYLFVGPLIDPEP